MEKLEEDTGDSVRPKNKFDSHGESIQDRTCKTSNDVRCRDVGSEESTREEVGCGGNEDVKMDDWSHQDDRIRNERIRGTTKVGEIYKKVQESRSKWYGRVLKKRRRIRRQESDGDGGAGEKICSRYIVVQLSLKPTDLQLPACFVYQSLSKEV